jgi:hypothetical protein
MVGAHAGSQCRLPGSFWPDSVLVFTADVLSQAAQAVLDTVAHPGALPPSLALLTS